LLDIYYFLQSISIKEFSSKRLLKILDKSSKKQKFDIMGFRSAFDELRFKSNHSILKETLLINEVSDYSIKNLIVTELSHFEECKELFLNPVDISFSFDNFHSECNHLNCSKHASEFIKDFVSISNSLSDFYHYILRDASSILIDRNYYNYIYKLFNDLVSIAIYCGNIIILKQLLFICSEWSKFW
jgi:hypothetical protein